jgi:hypothetical protein
MHKHYPPKHKESQFHCVHCGVYAMQSWGDFLYKPYGYGSIEAHKVFDYCVCLHCQKWSYWFDGKMVVPGNAPVPPAHPDMPALCKGDYDEARDIVGRSPRAAAALLRLVVQKLMAELGEPGKKINDDIGNLVAKGLPPLVQQALDFCRVVGNNAVHPGELDLNDTPEIAHSIFEMVNVIVEERIARPKQIQALYEKLPAGARAGIAKRDGLAS